MFKRLFQLRHWRWQFSLRGLLFLMLLVGVGLTIFRWPWVEVKKTLEASSPFGGSYTAVLETRTTLRRNWRAQPVKNGFAQTWCDGVLREETHFYDGERHGALRHFDEQARLTFEVHFRHGQAHGPYRVGDGQDWAVHGGYFNNRRHGEWQTYYVNIRPRIDQERILDWDEALRLLARISIPKDRPLIQSSWHHGRRHGSWTWQSPSGKPLHTALYNSDELTRWNGEPVVEDFWQWLRGPEVNDPLLVAELTAANEPGWRSRSDYITRDLCFDVRDRRLFVHLPTTAREKLIPPPAKGRFVPALCELAARNDLRFEYRFGALSLVPRSETVTAFIDPTGVSRVEFAAGSPQARDWNAVLNVTACDDYAAKCVAHLISGTSISLEVEGVGQPFPRRARQPPDSDQLFTRRRRDVLAYVLYTTGCRCEQDGNKLRILPLPKRSETLSLTKPLEPLWVDPFR